MIGMSIYRLGTGDITPSSLFKLGDITIWCGLPHIFPDPNKNGKHRVRFHSLAHPIVKSNSKNGQGRRLMIQIMGENTSDYITDHQESKEFQDPSASSGSHAAKTLKLTLEVLLVCSCPFLLNFE